MKWVQPNQSFLSFGVGDQRQYETYMKQHDSSAVCAYQTANLLQKELLTWHRFLMNLRSALAGSHDYHDEQGNIQGHLNLVHRLETISLSTSKAALDCCLGGLYVQAFMLLRHIFETWQRIAYTLLVPGSANSWLSTETRKATPPSQGAIDRALLKSPLKAEAQLVQRTVSQLNAFAHPSHGIITAYDSDNPGFMLLGGGYSEGRAIDVMANAARAHILILNQHRWYMSPSDAWIDRFRESVQLAVETFPKLGFHIGPAEDAETD